MRLSALLLVLSLAGIIGGAWLIGRWAVGCAVIADSVAVAVWAVLRDDGQHPPSALPSSVDPPDLHDVLTRSSL